MFDLFGAKSRLKEKEFEERLKREKEQQLAEFDARAKLEKEEQLAELLRSEEFKKLVKESAASLVKETKEAAIREKEEEKQLYLAKVAKATEDVKTLGESMEDSPEPFCNVLSLGFDPTHGIRVSLDYNSAFIRYLNKMGIKASNDEETVRLWLAHLNYDITQDMLAEDYLVNGVSEDETPPVGYDDMFGVDEQDPDESFIDDEHIM